MLKREGRNSGRTKVLCGQGVHANFFFSAWPKKKLPKNKIPTQSIVKVLTVNMCGGLKTVERILLPKNVKPIGYKVHLTPDMKACTYKGLVKTELVVLDTTPENTITFHSMELVIDFAQVQLERNGATVTATSHKINADDEMTSVTFPGAPFAAGEVLHLSVPFTNKLNDEMAGFYRSKYTVNGEERSVKFQNLLSYFSRFYAPLSLRRPPLPHVTQSENILTPLILARNQQMDRYHSI